VGTTSCPPKWIKPQLTRLIDEAPAGDGWLHEIKYDGYRMHARIDGGTATLLTRTGAGLVASLPARHGSQREPAFVTHPQNASPRGSKTALSLPQFIRKRTLRREGAGMMPSSNPSSRYTVNPCCMAAL
jgi:hypothetical protein